MDPVMVKKANGACAKTSPTSTAIGQRIAFSFQGNLIDSTVGHELLSFLDAYSGYHQIFMHPDDAEKTTFVTPSGMSYYELMPFGLKSAGTSSKARWEGT